MFFLDINVNERLRSGVLNLDTKKHRRNSLSHGNRASILKVIKVALEGGAPIELDL